MPPPETMFCSQQINIPTGLPEVLKNFTKAAIRTQPKDLLVWSAAYFDALAKGEILPVKERLEINFGSQTKDAMLTPGLLKTLHKQLSTAETCGREMLQDKWKALCLPMEQLENMLILGNFSMDVNWMEFFALGCSALGDSLKTSLKVACEILTEDEEGGAARIPFEIFSLLCTYLANLDPEMPQGHIVGFLASLEPQVKMQHGMIKPLDFIHREDMKPPNESSD
ncbi:ropporin-1-like protein [Hippocampus zosterae]|uniref:ropporin-1-like protein n=1 Tax=Hippocampus zosterae TaxID=109293 RepID=UPI00223D17F8|nr:ropporin-1-like protein [Hippocampus zosterae]XP_051910656.1 ropporin-1-like protein [Hippocampus zosterae]XP_051910657.1 ropporin-1-like protein [Hippocampus zosterae]XP_051910658.1 ropporin-1-like protein [Hippocampus zosterae]